MLEAPFLSCKPNTNRELGSGHLKGTGRSPQVGSVLSITESQSHLTQDFPRFALYLKLNNLITLKGLKLASIHGTLGTKRTRPLGHRSGLAQGSSLHGPQPALELCELRPAGRKPRPWPLPPSQPCGLGDLQHEDRWVTWVPGGVPEGPGAGARARAAALC